MSRRSAPSAVRSLVMVLGIAILLSPPAAALADDATPGPANLGARSCADRFPAEGPAGLDLQLGCVAAEIVAGYTGGGATSEPAKISAWLLPLGLFAAGLIVVMLVLRTLGGRFNRRMAPAMPAAWWSCPRCHSLNEDHARVCYACGQAWTPSAMILAGRTSPPLATGGPATSGSPPGTVIHSSDPPGPPRGPIG